MVRSTLLVAALAVASLSPAFAQTAEQRAACGADVKKFCDGVQPGGGRILDCLAKQKDKLADACKKVVAAQGK
jgi:hypothetical protein